MSVVLSNEWSDKRIGDRCKEDGVASSEVIGAVLARCHKVLDFHLNKFARRYARLGLSKDDFRQEAVVSLIEALPKYDSDKGALTTFVAPYIKKACREVVLFHSTCLSVPKYQAGYLGSLSIPSCVGLDEAEQISEPHDRIDDFVALNNEQMMYSIASSALMSLTDAERELVLDRHNIGLTDKAKTWNELAKLHRKKPLSAKRLYSRAMKKAQAHATMLL